MTITRPTADIAQIQATGYLGDAVYLDHLVVGSGGGEPSVITDASGHYTFDVPAGTYTVREVMQTGWTQTYPGGNGAATVVVAAGQTATQDFGNHIPPGRIAGDKWNDLDGDGVRDAGEPTLPGWTIYLDTDNDGQLDPGEPSQVTDASGHYLFDNLPPATYHVREVAQTGWTQSYPGGTLYFSADNNSSGLYSLNTTTGAATHIGISGVNGSTVGLVPSGTPGVLYGSKWSTLLRINTDGSGAVDLGGVGNEGLAFDPTTGTLYGELNGQFRTINTANGSIVQTLPVPGADVEGLDYGKGYVYGLVCVGSGAGTPGQLLRYSIAGGTWSLVGNTGLGSITNAGLAYDPGQDVLYAKVVTNTNLYAINPNTAATTLIGNTGLTPGGGLAFSGTGGNGAHTVVLAPGQTVTGKDFGNHAMPGSIAGDKWNDRDGDGVRDAGEPTLPGWTIYLDTDGNGQLTPGEPTQVTDASGHYVFTSLSPGTYTVREVLQAGWTQTYPGGDGAHTVVLAIGQAVTGKDFGNNDSTPPAAPSVPVVDAVTDGGVVGDNITNYNRPQFDGTAEAGSTVTISTPAARGSRGTWPWEAASPRAASTTSRSPRP